jgi:hypothetical protein
MAKNSNNGVAYGEMALMAESVISVAAKAKWRVKQRQQNEIMKREEIIICSEMKEGVS